MPAATEGKNAVLATILSLIIPGLGQFYTGQIGKGIMFLIIDGVAWSLIFSIVGALIGIPMAIVTTIWSAIDAYKAVNG